jgi:hypothetical protein
MSIGYEQATKSTERKENPKKNQRKKRRQITIKKNSRKYQEKFKIAKARRKFGAEKSGAGKISRVFQKAAIK